MYYLNVFFIYSILGFILETLMIKGFSSGILFGPWTPVYGIGVIFIMLIYKKLDKKIHNNFFKVFLLFILSSILLSLLEWCGGVLIKCVFNKVYWSYENMRYNFGHYIALEVAVIWGVMSILIIYLIRPILDKVVKSVPKWLTCVLSSLFMIDVILTLLIK